MAYLNDSQIVSRSENVAIELPTQVAKDVVKATAQESVIARLARQVPMTSKKTTQPLIGALPVANWVNGDTGLKQSSSLKFEGKTITAEALATLVVVPDEFFDDSQIPIWDEVLPLVAEAMGRRIDDAALFGNGAPASWTENVFAHASAAGNTITLGQNPTGSDLGQDAAAVGLQLARDGFNLNGWAAETGLQWRLLGSRDDNGAPIFTQFAGEEGGMALYGYPLVQSAGAWQSDTVLIGGDWSNALFGLRQDVTATIHTDAVITDANGVVVFNAMQQDAKIMRVVMRVGFGITNPATPQNTVASARSPFALLLDPAAS